jgi:hypothetical protein
MQKLGHNGAVASIGNAEAGHSGRGQRTRTVRVNFEVVFCGADE